MSSRTIGVHNNWESRSWHVIVGERKVAARIVAQSLKASKGADLVDITVRHSGGKKVTASTDKYVIVTDQTVDDGGDASAPAPFDLFLSSIATCAGHYVYEFCQRRDIPIDGIDLLMNWERDEKTRHASP